MTITFSIDAFVLCFSVVAVLAGGFFIKWWKDDKR